MDNPRSAPEQPEAARRRRHWPVAVAILALATALFSLATLRGGPSESAAPASATNVDLAALAKQSPLAVPLYQGLEQQQAAAPAAPAAPAGSAKSVEAMGYKFTPASLTISVGDTVTWTNHDTAPHNIVVTDGPEKFTSPTLQTGQTFSHTFTKAGTYSYYCSIHPDMKATVTVTGSAPTSAPPTTAPPTSAPTSAPSHSMPMPSTPTGGGSCVPKSVLQPIIDHVKSAHLETSPGQQVQDILNLDQYIKTHTVWLETVLAPAFDGSAGQVVTDTLAPIVAHIKSAHLEESLGQQVSDLLNLDQYIKTHTVWLENVLTPLLNQASC
ncbi:cupredoxin domain-containing protein [Amycolatopsis australiensis]|uniref:Amicyanin n=1 Tax=Amycolatopsis australiensis TaxID=546364 RepID=A0A1K1SMS6_9PSEU|nr:cupredoxin family copper-binding protein [Amycolatopsis australiensis]SFW85516.1 amicyanin [Amycolatopsis australiensis]